MSVYQIFKSSHNLVSFANIFDYVHQIHVKYTMIIKQKSIQLIIIIIFILRLSMVSDLATFQSLEVTSNKVLLGNMDLLLGNAFQLLQLKIPAIKVFASGEGLTQCSLPIP